MRSQQNVGALYKYSAKNYLNVLTTHYNDPAALQVHSDTEAGGAWIVFIDTNCSNTKGK